MRLLSLILLVSFSIAAWGDSNPESKPEAGDTIEVIDATVRVPIPGKDNTSAYFLLRNPGDREQALVDIHVDFAERAELHNHETRDGMMRMRQVESVAIAPGEEVRFQSGGYHVMLFELKRRPRTGDPLDLVLEFEDGSRQSVKAHAVSVFDRPHH